MHMRELGRKHSSSTQTICSVIQTEAKPEGITESVLDEVRSTCLSTQSIPINDSTNVVDHNKMDVNWLLCAGQLENIFADLTECGIVLSKLKTEVLPNPIKFILESVQIISRIKSKSKDFLKNANIVLEQFSEGTDSVYCFVCSLFSHGPDKLYSNAAWITTGVNQWHKMKSCGAKKLGKLEQHFSSTSYKASIKLEQEIDFKKNIVIMLFDIARTLARQGLTFRGNGDESGGHFMQLVKLLSRHNPLIDRWIKEIFHYLGPRSQNEFIELLANETPDTTPDITHEDRLAVCTRYVNNQGLITFQSYDFASNMSGKFNGAHVKLSELTGHRIPFIPCQAHRLNTFLEHSCDASTIIANMVDTLENLYVFFSASSKRYGLLNIKLSEIENALQLRNLSKTRWTARAESVKAVWGSLEAIIKSLDEICTDTEHFDKLTRSKALGLQKQLLSFDFIVSIYYENDDEIKSDDQAINNLIDSALSFATLLGTNPESYFKTHHRRRLCPKRIDSRPSTEVEFTIHLFYRREFKLVLNTLITLSNSNLKQCLSSVQPLFQLFSKPLDKSNITLENITNSLSLFPVDKSLMEKSEEVKHILPCANLLCRLALTSPVTVASNERTFSKLKLVNIFLRSTMNDDRLNSLVILGIEKDIVDQLNINKLAQQWSNLKERRIQI
ncbi:Uncharacterized protein FWK35_00029971 [Aphis craccivora]|uniref:HAT C-terminal dimerisation domain-containing protein n=1 Tax=Aphis craccivora TaxID=307492 RepID=A0A6G0VWN4_APHCR|nr:Uncharacterized protein FWK35_00029971 [Aphis craccivora]